MLNIEKQPSKNTVRICGTLNTLEVNEGISRAGTQYASANITVRVIQEVVGNEVECIIPVRMFAVRQKKDGTPNSVYDHIISLKEKYTPLSSLAQDSDKRPSRVLFQSASLKENLYKVDDRVVSSCSFSGSYMEAAPANVADCATFECSGVVVRKFEEIDKQTEEETGNLKVTLGLVQWGGQVDYIDMIASTQAGINAINNGWNEYDTVNVAGTIYFTNEETTVHESLGFGPDLIKTTTKKCRKLMILGGSVSCLDDQYCYDVDEFKSACQQRKERINGLTSPQPQPQSQQQAQHKTVAERQFGF